MNTHHFLASPLRHVAVTAPLVVATLLCANVALAQPAQTPQDTPGVTKPAPAGFQSALDGYKPYTDDKTVDWKAANDTTAKIGGWRAYAKEAAQTSPTQGAAPTAPANPTKP